MRLIHTSSHEHQSTKYTHETGKLTHLKTFNMTPTHNTSKHERNQQTNKQTNKQKTRTKK